MSAPVRRTTTLVATLAAVLLHALAPAPASWQPKLSIGAAAQGRQTSEPGDPAGRQVVPNDELYEAYQWNLRQIRAPEAWELTTGSAAVLIAVLDTGVALTHPDLIGKLVNGYDFVNDDPVPDDDHGNGTHVAGIAAAETNNTIGIAGLSWFARILPVKVLDSNARGEASRVAQGIIFATDRGARIINLGLAGSTPSPALQDAIDYAYSRGVLVIAPVGTEGTSEPSYPAASRNVMAVAATDRADRRLPSSNTGDYISVAAPGENIGSTYRAPGGGTGYAIASTTAQAAAQVAGLAALIWSINPALGPGEVRAIIESSADDVGPRGRDAETGFGRINAARAVHFAAPWFYFARGGGSYTPPTVLRNTVYFPLVKKDVNGASTSFTIQNTARFSANARIELVDAEGSIAHVITTMLPANGSATYEQGRMVELPRGFQGSAVIRSEVPLAGVLNEDRAGRDRMTYEGIAAGAPIIWVPLLMREYGGWSTGLQVQNVSPTTTEVLVTFYTRGSEAPLTTSRFGVAPSAARTLYQPDDDRIPGSWVGSAVVESVDGEPVAVIVNQVHTSGLAMSYVGTSRPAPTVYAPLLFKGARGWNTGLQLQNAGSAFTAALATFTRTNGEGGPWSETVSMAAGAAVTLYQPASPDLPGEFVGAAVVRATGGQPLTGIVNQIRYETPTTTAMAMAYGSPAVGAPNVYVPLLYRGYSGWNSGLQVQNLGTQRTLATISFYTQDGALVTTLQQVIEPETSITAYLPAVDRIAPGFIGSAVVASSGLQPLAAIVNHVR